MLTTKQCKSVVLSGYLLALVYCLVWIPWHAKIGPREIRLNYGFIWAGPHHSRATITFSESDIDPNPGATHSYFDADRYDQYATPDLRLITMRVLIVTALFGAIGALTKLGADG